jgi:glycosyltransferase involved in cell wall biosynthesis
VTDVAAAGREVAHRRSFPDVERNPVSGVRPVRTAYVTTEDPRDVRPWSGLFLYIGRALAGQGFDIDPLGPLKKKNELYFKAKEGMYRFALRRRHPRDREPAIAKSYAQQLGRLIGPKHELVFSSGTLAIPYLECEQPIAFWSDATWALMIDYYPVYSNLSARSLRHGHTLEQAALDRSSLAVYSSDWAARSAVEDYGLPPERIAVVPFGANIEADLSPSQAEAAVAARDEHVCRLLFIGAEWERKGGPLALDVARLLNDAGIPTQIDVVGRWPAATDAPPFARPFGFVDKSSPAGRELLRTLLLEAHFLLLPSRAECSAIVLSEAAAHAVPALTTRVGGSPTIVRDGVNGRLFDRDAGPDEYVEFVGGVFGTPAYRSLALSSVDEYRRRLNWDVAGSRVRELVGRVL